MKVKDVQGDECKVVFNGWSIHKHQIAVQSELARAGTQKWNL